MSHSPASDLGSAVAKIKLRVLPLFVVMFIVNYLDRVNIGFARSHLETDLGIDSAAYGLGAGLFFISYAIFEIPSNLLLQKVGARLWLTRITLTWGVVASLMAFVRGETGFYVLRFLLGAAEAGFFPGVIYYFTRWLPAPERGKAVAIFLSGSAIASVISGPVSGALLQINGFGLRGWQWMFLIEGLMSVLICGVTWFYLDSLPHDATWLTPGEKSALAETIAQDAATTERGTSRPAAHPNKPQPLETEELPVGSKLLRAGTSRAPLLSPKIVRRLLDPQILLFCIIYFAIQLTIYAATFWLPSIIQRMGHLTDLQVGLFNSIPWIISVAAMYAFASASARSRHPQAWVAVTLLIAGLGMFLSTRGGPIFAFVAICFAATGFKSASSLFWPIPQGYLDSGIAAGVIALINSIGNLGGFVAPTVFGLLEKKTGSIQGGLYGLACTSILTALIVFAIRVRPRRG